MALRSPLLVVFLSLLFSRFCCGQQTSAGNATNVTGLRGAVQSVSTETFLCRNNSDEIRVASERSFYNHAGDETDVYRYDRRGVLFSHTVFTRNASHLVKAETMHLPSMNTSVELYNADGFLIDVSTYDDHGTLIAKTVNDLSGQKEKPTASLKKATDGSISTIDRSADGSFKETTMKPDGTTVTHAHYRASAEPPLFLPLGNSYGDWYQTSDANHRSLEFIEDAPTGEYLKISTEYDKSGRQLKSAAFDRSGKLLSETTFRYPQEDESGNWTEQQIWYKTNSNSEMCHQVTHRTITYYRNSLDGGR